MKFKMIMVSLVVLVLTTGVFAQKVTYNFLPGTDFSKYRTYKWQKVERAQYPNQLLDDQIMRSIDTQLRSKGLMLVDKGPTDLVVVYQAAVTLDKECNA